MEYFQIIPRVGKQHKFTLICIKNECQLKKGILDNILQAFSGMYQSWYKAVYNSIKI